MRRPGWMLRRLVLPGALVAIGLLATACTEVPESFKNAAAVECPSGSDCYDPPKPAGPGGALTVEADEFLFNITAGADSVQEGPIEVTLENIGSAEHNFTIDEAVGNTAVPEGEDLPGGETATATLELFSGTYTYYCSVPGHREQGMEGTISIAAAGAAPVEAGPTPAGETEADPGQEGAPVEPPATEGTPVEPVPEGPAETEAVDEDST